MSLNFPVQMIKDTIPLFNTEWILVDVSCNSVDVTPNNFGATNYSYYIDRYTISESAIKDYNRDPNNILRQINGIDTRGNNKPVTTISWNESARFVNWLNEKEGIQPAYKFTTSGVNDNITLWDSADAWQNGGENRYRHRNTKYFIPSEDEWYKAAYFDPAIRAYYNHAGGSDSPPAAITSGTGTNTAVYTDGVVVPTEPADITLAGGLSPFGTMGQGGNTNEWIESAADGTNNSVTEVRSLRGGSYESPSGGITNAARSDTEPTSASNTLGLRVAYAPMGAGSVSPDTLLTFVDVGSAYNLNYVPGNGTGDWPAGEASAANGKGGVNYDYQMSKFAIKVCDINAYNQDPVNVSRQIVPTNTAGFNANPVVGMTWNTCARFVNWLNEKEGEQPAYNFTTGGVNDNISLWDSTSAWQNGGENRFRHTNARYFIPSEDEWIKAAFYDPNYGGTDVGGYHRYPHPTGDPLVSPPQTAATGGTDPNTTRWNGSINSPDQGRVPVDFAGGLSYYGTMGQAGNAYEFHETTVDGLNDAPAASNRSLRGGTASISVTSFLSIDAQVSNYTATQSPGPGGFRVARAEVGTGAGPFPADPVTELLFNEFDVEAETTPNTGSGNQLPGQDVYSLFQSTVINNGVVTFDGTGDNINIPDNDIHSFTDGSGTDSPFSISCWVRSHEAIGSDQVIIAKQTSGAYEWALSYTPTGEVNIILSTSDLTTGSIEATSTSTFTVSAWQHVLVTYDGTKDETGLKIYIDGTSETVTAVENGTYTGMSNTSSNVFIGRRPIGLTGAADEFQGDMDNMRIYGRILADKEIAALFFEGHDTYTI